jgi:hypothetical protein
LVSAVPAVPTGWADGRSGFEQEIAGEHDAYRENHREDVGFGFHKSFSLLTYPTS